MFIAAEVLNVIVSLCASNSPVVNICCESYCRIYDDTGTATLRTASTPDSTRRRMRCSRRRLMISFIRASSGACMNDLFSVLRIDG